MGLAVDKIKLMIVDDSLLIRRKIERVHDQERYDLVGHAVDGGQAISMFKELRPDLVTMDLTMPNVDGLECIDRLMEVDPEVNILVVSALADEATGIQALQKGASGFLMKPFTEDDLSEALDIASEEFITS